jgi:hypothetical protein
MQVSFNMHIGTRNADGSRGVTIFAYPYRNGVMGPGYELINKDVALSEIETYTSVQSWLQNTLMKILGTIQEDVHDAGYVAVQDLRLEAIKRKPS